MLREVIVFTAVVLAAAVRVVRFKAALRVHLAVTWLTVYRQLHILVLVARARAPKNNVQPAVNRQPGYRWRDS